jgi:SAM-dependent methyltransferase
VSIVRRRNDAFGREILAHHQGHAVREIIERDDGLIELSGGPAAYFAPFRRWYTGERWAMRYARGRVLDVGAGAGRVALHLQQRGAEVTAIDNSPLAIKVCRQRGVRRALLRPIERIGAFGTGSFDTIVMFGNNFGLMGSFDKARRLLGTMYRITSPGGVILAETLDPHGTTDPVHRAYHRRNRRRGRMAGQIRIRVRFRECIGAWFDYLLVSRREMRAIVRGTGWKVRELLDTNGPFYIAVLVKD